MISFIDISKIRKPGRKVSDHAVQEMADSLNEIGQSSPLHLNKQNNIQDGVARYWAARKLGWTKLKVSKPSPKKKDRRTKTVEWLTNFTNRVRRIPNIEGRVQIVDTSDAERLDEITKHVAGMETQIKGLKERDAILSALEAGGVDNWEGYDHAMAEVD